ncbi:MAG: helix-turn-helix transcriptional regulator, partial [Lentisphaerae bacterium]|nr:helix-turn-helix transcriptional regulator [Lentisphaerota bacterium]
HMPMAPQVAGCQALLAEHVAQRVCRADLAAPLMQALLAATFRQFMTERDGAAAPPDSATRQRALFERARLFIEANSDHALGTDEIADFTGVGPRQLNRIFRARDGRSVTAFVHERRLERARAMLSEGHSAKETAYTCGFKDPAYFTRFFKRYTGKTPSQYARSRPGTP